MRLVRCKVGDIQGTRMLERVLTLEKVQKAKGIGWDRDRWLS